MKLLHSADWHLDSPIYGRTQDQTDLLRGALLQLPHKVVTVARETHCDLMLLSGDLFDGAYTPESLEAVKTALKEAEIPVFISPAITILWVLPPPGSQKSGRRMCIFSLPAQ